MDPFKDQPTKIPPLNTNQTESKAQIVNILFTKLAFFCLYFVFCHTESKNVATTLICATGSHTKNHGSLVAQLL